MAYAGHKCLVKVSGTALTLTDAATSTSDNKKYTITDPSKILLDPTASITVEEDGVVTTEAYTINRLAGSIEFETADPLRGVITISGMYLPASTVAEAHEFSYSLEANNEDATTFQSAWVKRQQTTKDFGADLSAWHDVEVDVFSDALMNGKLLVLEFYVNDVLDIRAWVIPASDEVESAADALVEESIEFEGTTDKEKRAVYIG